MALPSSLLLPHRGHWEREEVDCLICEGHSEWPGNLKKLYCIRLLARGWWIIPSILWYILICIVQIILRELVMQFFSSHINPSVLCLCTVTLVLVPPAIYPEGDNAWVKLSLLDRTTTALIFALLAATAANRLDNARPEKVGPDSRLIHNHIICLHVAQRAVLIKSRSE